ncbi:tetratricopeptide repeat protein [Rhizobiaceae bacterium BDR2-2]|uniref:Tetratricopeptide repeat protein n=1 Tax=Ectorhizobium quercum TaxID=2965071 RepID=A0AAE3SX28_9HYPH|nr:tetratricopeptide repeat protein [Ectorhizobium quercum]MCX8996327.1 tetratricopeptide repeat protein [Ectorhizobium quercum]MCX8998634.1 tetratricopeptide repeat protein [Ectorhizobium quercum]
MRQGSAIRLLSGTALALLVGFTSLPAHAQEEKPETVETGTFDPDSINSFSGALLAAGNADTDKDYKMAAALYRKALAFEPGHVEIRERLMFTLLMSGDFEEGAKLAEELKTGKAFERVTTVVRATDAIRRKDYAAADAILKYNGPNDLDRLMNSLLAAWSMTGAGKGAEALTQLERLRGPDWYALFRNYHAGAIAIVAGDQNKARRFLTAAVTDREGAGTAPDTFMRSVMALARLEAAAGNKQKALDSISAGEAVISNYAPLKALRSAIEQDEPQEQQVKDAAQGAGAVLFSVGGALNRPGAEDVVSLYLQIAHALDPQSADTLILLGGLAENLERPAEAIEYYRKVPENSPMRRVSELQLGLALAQTGEVEEARSHLKSLIEADPTDLRSYLSYGSVLSEAKDYKAMAENYDKAVEVIGNNARPQNWSIFFQRGIAYERLKEWDKAEPNFLKSLELNPDQPQVLNYLGYSWVDMNRNLDQGLEMIRKAVELRPDDGYIVDSLGWAYYRLGRFDEAVEELERATSLRAGDATINDHLGDAYWRVGRRLEAGFQWQNALKLNPELADIPKIEEKIKNGLPELTPEEVAQAAAARAAFAAEKEKAESAPEDTYTVEPGDTLWKIAVKVYGDGNRFIELIRANPALQRYPNRLAPGQILIVPPAE